MTTSFFPPSRGTRLARELLASAPVLQANNTVKSALARPEVDFEWLASLGHWCSGERLVVEAAAALARTPVGGPGPNLDWGELKYRLDQRNYEVVEAIIGRL